MIGVKVLITLGQLLWMKRLRLITCNTLKWTSLLIMPTMHQQTIAYKAMHWPDSITWTTHTEESTTLLEATRLQEAQLCTTLHYT